MLLHMIEFFSPWETEGRIALIYRAADLFGRYGFSGPDVDTSMAIDDGESTDKSRTDIWDDCYTILEIACDNLITQLGLELLNSNLDHKLSLLEGLKVVEDTDMHEYMVDICRNDSEPPRDRFETLIEFGLGYYPNWLDNELQNVPEAFLLKVLRLHERAAESTGANSEVLTVDKADIERIRKFYDYCKVINTRTHLHDLVEAQVRTRNPIDFVLGQHTEELTSYEPEAPEHAALELIGILLLCDINFNHLLEETGRRIEQIFTDMNFVSKAMASADRIISESGIQGQHIEEIEVNNG